MSGVAHWLGFALVAAGSGVLALRWVHHHVAWPLTWPEMVTDRTAETIRVATSDAGVLIFHRVASVVLASCDFCGRELRGAGWNHSDGAHGDTLICDPCAGEARV